MTPTPTVPVTTRATAMSSIGTQQATIIQLRPERPSWSWAFSAGGLTSHFSFISAVGAPELATPP
jgi:hypothetical protein